MVFIIAFTICTTALQETLTVQDPTKSALLEKRHLTIFEGRVLNRDDEQQRWRRSNEVNEFREAGSFPTKNREKRWGNYWHETHPKKKFRPSPLIWG